METYLPSKGASYGEQAAIAANTLYVKQKRGTIDNTTRMKPPRVAKRFAM